MAFMIKATFASTHFLRGTPPLSQRIVTL